MKLLLDSTYFFPLIGVQITSSPPNLLQNLLGQSVEIHLVEITLFELAAKGAQLIQKHQLTASDVIQGINSVLYEERFHKDSSWDSDVLRIAFELRTWHSDFIDCVILGGAIENANVLLTEDKGIQKLVQQNQTVRDIVTDENDVFEVLTGKEILRLLHSR